MELAQKLLGPTIAPQNPAVRPLGWRGGFWQYQAFIMAHLIQPFINAGGSPSAQEMYRSMRHSFEFTPDASSPFGYPKCAFNDFYLRDYLNSMV